MALVLNEEQHLLRESAQDFIAGQGPVAQLRRLRDERDALGYVPELWTGFVDMGFAGILVPEAQGGLGLGFAEAGIVMEAIGRHLTASPFWASSGVAATALRHAGGAQADGLLADIAAGRRTAALAVDEASRHRPQALATTARAAPDGGYVLNGTKRFVVDGHCADVLLVVARAETAQDGAGLSLLAVPRDTPGLVIERTVMLDAHNAAHVTMTDVTVGPDALLGVPGQADTVVEATLDAGRALAAAELLGVATEAFDRTLAYLKERRQFGQTIGEFQALQHRAAELYCDLSLSRAVVLVALQALDADPASAREAVSIAKAHACRTGALAVQEAVQMHGGMGMTDAFDIGLFMKRAQTLQMLLGDRAFHLDRLARLRGY